MSNLAQRFDSNTFQATVREYCAQQSWKIADLNDRRAILRFVMDDDRTQTCYIIRYESTLEFSVPSELNFDTINDVPHFFSTLLLQRSRDKKFGFWCLEEIGDRQVFSCMHNAEMQLLDSEFFARVVAALIAECDEFERYVDAL